MGERRTFYALPHMIHTLWRQVQDRGSPGL